MTFGVPSIIMAFEKHLFISYAHLDNVELVEGRIDRARGEPGRIHDVEAESVPVGNRVEDGDRTDPNRGPRGLDSRNHLLAAESAVRASVRV